jgi:transposase
VPGPITSALCWAHARRQFFELADIAANARRGKNAAAISPIALEAVKRIDALFDIERGINGQSAEQRLRMRKELSAPLVAVLEAWLREQRSRLSNASSVAGPIDYMLRRWGRFVRFLDDGRICLTNNAAERALRGFAIRGSLCTPFSSIWEHWKRVRVSNATRATFSGHRHFDRLRRQVISADLVGRSGNNLLSGKDTGFNKAA